MLLDNRGTGLVGAVATMGIAMLVAASLSQFTVTNSQATARLRRLTAAANLKHSIRELLRSPMNMECVNNGGINNCTYDMGSGPDSLASKINILTKSYANGACFEPGMPTNCDIEIVEAPKIDRDAEFDFIKGFMHYRYPSPASATGVVDVYVEVPIPVEVIQNSEFTCTDTGTTMTGFDGNGGIVCKPAPSPSRAPPGQFISSINPNTLEPVFSDLPTLVSDCTGGDSFLSLYEWQGKGDYNSQCGTRVDPFLLAD